MQISDMYVPINELVQQVDEEDIVTRFTCASISHIHSHKCLELAYVLKGEILHNVGGMTYKIHEGEFFIVDYDQFHSYLVVSGKDFRLINIMFRPRLFGSELSEANHLSDIYNHYLISIDKRRIDRTPMLTKFSDPTGLVRRSILAIVKEVNERELGWKEASRGLLINIIIQMLREVCTADAPKDGRSFAPQMMRYVRENYMSTLKITDSYPVGNYSAAYLSKQFKLETGVNFTEYVKRARIEASCRLLLNTDMAIWEIAELVGYRDSSFFHKTFQEFMNCSPAKYRKYYARSHPHDQE